MCGEKLASSHLLHGPCANARFSRVGPRRFFLVGSFFMTRSTSRHKCIQTCSLRSRSRHPRPLHEGCLPCCPAAPHGRPRPFSLCVAPDVVPCSGLILSFESLLPLGSVCQFCPSFRRTLSGFSVLCLAHFHCLCCLLPAAARKSGLGLAWSLTWVMKVLTSDTSSKGLKLLHSRDQRSRS